MADPKVIYLLCDCMADEEHGRMWCEDALECDECGSQPAEYKLVTPTKPRPTEDGNQP